MAEDTAAQSSSLPYLHKVPCLLFCLQLLLSSCSNIWLFTSSLLIYQVNPGTQKNKIPAPVSCLGSLTLPAVHGVIGMVATLVSTPYLGAWIDLTPRLTVATILCIVQSVAVSLSSVLLAVYLHYQDYLDSSQVLLGVLVVNNDNDLRAVMRMAVGQRPLLLCLLLGWLCWQVL